MASYRFGTVEVRPAERRVLAAGEPAALGARAFDLLVALIENRDRVMSKDELLSLVWPGVVVEENNLQVQVSTLRKLLGPEAISTLPGRGYRFTLVPDVLDAVPPPGRDRRHNLPAELNSFVGREDEIAAVGALLATSRLVTLTGVGGTGKTRLSLHVASCALPQFRDGAWLVELAPLSDERHVSFAIAAAIGVPDGDLGGYLRDRQLLLVLDNCEHLLRGCAEAARQALEAGPGVRILASSREPLHVRGEATYRVPPLSRPQAIQLFVERARAANPSFQPQLDSSQAVVEICKRLDGLPLAIELAAARVRALSVAKIAERLDDRFRLLTGGDQTAMARQQTLRASIDWSFELLSTPERALLRRLSVFAGGWTLEAAEAVAGGGEIEQSASVLELLAGLVEKSLVAIEPDGSRYHLLETVREYAAEQLEESGEEAAMRRRHLEHYLELAAHARLGLKGPEQAAWLQRLDADRENMVAAQAWGARSEQTAILGLRLISTLKQYWVSRGQSKLARAVILGALERTQPGTRQRGRTLFDAGQLAFFLGHYAEARAHLEESLAIARAAGDEAAVVQVLQPLGYACLGQEEFDAAGRYLEESAELASRAGTPLGIAATVNALAHLRRMQGDFAGAEPLYERALACVREIDDRESIGLALLNLAMTGIERGAAEGVASRLAEALAIAQDIGSKRVGQGALETCAGYAALRGAHEACARFYGCAEAEAGRTSLRRDPVDEAFLAPRLKAARDAMGAARFQEAERAGRELAYEAGLADARAWLTNPR
jgi:non-specific serine/threonine protein kinase